MTELRPHPLLQKTFTVPVLAGLFVLVGVVGLVFSTIIRNPYTIIYPLVLLLSPLLYLAVRSQNEGEAVETPARVVKGFVILYAITFIVLVAAYYTANFYRSPAVFHLTFGLYVLTAVLIWLRPAPSFSLPVLCCTGLTNRLTAYYASALYVGNDYYIHYYWIEGIVSSGSLAPLTTDKYYYAPLYHIYTAIGDLLLAVPVSDAGALTTVVAVTVVPPVVIFALIRQYWDRQVAIMGAFLYMAGDYAIYRGAYAATTAFALVLFCILLFAIVRYQYTQRPKFMLLGLAGVGLISLSHQVTLFIAAVFVCTYFGGRALYEGTVRRGAVLVPLICGLAVFADFMTTRRLGPAGESTFLDSYLGVFILQLTTGGTSSRQEATLPQDPSIAGVGAAGLDVMQIAGSGLLLILALAGTLYWLHTADKPNRTLPVLQYGGSVGVMYALTLGAPIVGVSILLPSRWFSFIYLLLAILAAPFVAAFIRAGTQRLSRKHIHGAVVMVVLFSVPFVVLMGGNHVSAPDDPYFDSAPGAERFGVTQPEKALFDHTAEYNSEETPVITDRRAGLILRDHYRIEVEYLEVVYGNPDSVAQPALVVERQYSHTDHAQYLLEHDGRVHDVSGPVPITELDHEDRSTTYDNGEDELTYLAED